jgi:hypothetical protein
MMPTLENEASREQPMHPKLCHTMGHPLRIEIMHILSTGPMDVNNIVPTTHACASPPPLESGTIAKRGNRYDLL